MGIVQRRERERNARRQAIVRAAMDAYWEEGYHATTMEKIAARAELSRATLYLYFKTKDEIFVHGIAAHSAYFAGLLQGIVRRLAVIGEGLAATLWEAFQRYYRKDPVTFNATLYFHQSEMIRRLPDPLRMILDRSGSQNYALLCRIMEHGAAQGLFLKCDPRTLAEVVWTAFLGIVQLENSKAAMGRKQHLRETWELGLAVLSRGIEAPGRRAPAGQRALDIHLR